MKRFYVQPIIIGFSTLGFDVILASQWVDPNDLSEVGQDDIYL